MSRLAVVPVAALLCVVLAACAAPRGGAQRITRYEPTVGWFTSGWDRDVLAAEDPERQGRSEVASSIDATTAARALWPLAAAKSGVLGDGARATDYQLVEVFRVWRPTLGSISATSAEGFWQAMQPTNTYLAALKDEGGDLKTFGLSRQGSTWEYSKTRPAGTDHLAQTLLTHGRGEIRLLHGAENIVWAVGGSGATLSAILLDYPPTVRMFVQGRRLERGQRLPWRYVLLPIELRF